MSSIQSTREAILKEVESLPSEFLPELANFINYLHYKTIHQSSAKEQTKSNSGVSFLLSISGLGKSEEIDVSERTEEILLNEVDPIYGWNIKTKN